MKEFSPIAMIAVNGAVCLELKKETAAGLKAAFLFAGTWYIRERDASYKGGGVYAAGAKTEQ